MVYLWRQSCRSGFNLKVPENEWGAMMVSMQQNRSGSDFLSAIYAILCRIATPYTFDFIDKALLHIVDHYNPEDGRLENYCAKTLKCMAKGQSQLNFYELTGLQLEWFSGECTSLGDAADVDTVVASSSTTELIYDNVDTCVAVRDLLSRVSLDYLERLLEAVSVGTGAVRVSTLSKIFRADTASAALVTEALHLLSGQKGEDAELWTYIKQVVNERQGVGFDGGGTSFYCSKEA